MDIVQDVIGRLLEFKVSADPGVALSFAIAQAREIMLANLNLDEIPDGLYYKFVDLAAGLYLRPKFAVGDLDGFDIDAAVASVKEGDTTVSYLTTAGLSEGERISTFLTYLLTLPETMLSRYRRFVW